MRSTYKNNFATNSLIKLKDQKWLDNARVAGKIAAKTLLLLEDLIKNKTFHSLKTLNDVAEKYIVDSGGECTFKGYHGFPCGVCISVNKQLVHGIPTDYVLDDGDVISFDLGVTVNGSIADTAITTIFGELKSKDHIRLVAATESALMKSIELIKVGTRLGSIGNSIYKHGKDNGFSVVDAYGGHGLCMTEDGLGIPHAAPFISNKASVDDGVRIQAGMALAIEPLFVIGNSNKTTVGSDNWTVSAEGICSHHEHSIFIHEDHVEILTDRTGL